MRNNQDLHFCCSVAPRSTEVEKTFRCLLDEDEDLSFIESVDSFTLTLHELGSKCGFTGEEYNHCLVDQFILGLRDRSTQNKLLQEPPMDLDAALFVALRFEAANSTMKKLKVEQFEVSQSVHSVGSRTQSKVCFSCNGYGHVSRECPPIKRQFRGVVLPRILMSFVTTVSVRTLRRPPSGRKKQS